MRSAVRLAGASLLVLGCALVAGRSAQAVDFILADFENNGTGTGGAGTDFDTQPTDNTPACSGCWYEGAGQQTFTDITQSTIGATHGTKSMKVNFIGKGAGGGDGLQDTHFATPVRVAWSPATDPRFLAIRNAANANQALYTIDFDLTYDIPQLRSLHWLGPPVDFPAKPEKFIGVGIYKTSNNDGGPYVHAALEQVLPTLINPFNPAYDGTTYLTIHSSVAFEDFQFLANSTTATLYELGFSVNGNWGTNPASSNTEAASMYFDNIVLKQFNPVAPIDYNNNGLADTSDWTLFMAQYLKSNPPAPPNPNTSFDLVGSFGAAGMNGKVDFHDLQEFQHLYQTANPGAAALSLSVPEPTTAAMASLGLLGLIIAQLRRRPTPVR